MERVGILRLRGWCAARTILSAQDDKTLSAQDDKTLSAQDDKTYSAQGEKACQ
jgi:hypothetical protein